MHHAPAVLTVADELGSVLLDRALEQARQDPTPTAVDDARPDDRGGEVIGGGVQRQAFVGGTPSHQLRRSLGGRPLVRRDVAGVPQHPATRGVDEDPVGTLSGGFQKRGHRRVVYRNRFGGRVHRHVDQAIVLGGRP